MAIFTLSSSLAVSVPDHCPIAQWRDRGRFGTMSPGRFGFEVQVPRVSVVRTFHEQFEPLWELVSWIGGTVAFNEVRVLAPNSIAKVARSSIRARKLPKTTYLCLAPGATRATAWS
jgi:hypothetical protein